MTQETIFQILTEAALEARKDKAKELSALLNTFLSDLREHVTGGVSASIYGIYKPTDEQVVPFLVKTIQGLDKGIEIARKSDTPSAKTYIQSTQLKIETLSLFLPKALTDEELQEAVIKAIDSSSLEITDKKLFGSVMASLKSNYEGRYVPSEVRSIFERITKV